VRFCENRFGSGCWRMLFVERKASDLLPGIPSS
jgi:hypothetical protein